MKREVRLQELIHEMEAGRLSRNKNFEAYKQPDVANAWARRGRLKRLLEMLDRHDAEGWQFQLEKNEEDGIWTLFCRSEKLNGSWTARLFEFELQLLYHHPFGETLLMRPL